MEHSFSHRLEKIFCYQMRKCRKKEHWNLSGLTGKNEKSIWIGKTYSFMFHIICDVLSNYSETWSKQLMICCCSFNWVKTYWNKHKRTLVTWAKCHKGAQAAGAILSFKFSWTNWFLFFCPRGVQQSLVFHQDVHYEIFSH